MLVRRLLQCDAVEHVLAMDIRPLQYGASKGLTAGLPPNSVEKLMFVRQDIRAPLSDLLAAQHIDSVAHLAFVLQPSHSDADDVNIRGMKCVLDACATVSVRHLLYLSSATVYGAHADNPPLLSEDAPLRPPDGFPYAKSKAIVESMLNAFAAEHSDVSVCVLRSSPVLGANADNFIAKSFSKPLLVGVRGYDPPMQFLHEDDAANILSNCILQCVSGTYNIGGRDSIRWSEAVAMSGRRMVCLPAPLLYAALGLTWRLRLQRSSPARGLDFIRYSWLVDAGKLARKHGLEASRTSREAWQDFLSRR